MNLLAYALEYHRRGLSILPISRDGKWKKPAIKAWKPYQTHQPKEDELKEWFKNFNLAGLAVVLGPVSGELYCRDFDIADSYQRWAEEHPELAKSLPTAQSKRGPHIYFRSHERIRTRDYGDGELRGIGGYCILPPSLHRSGHTYTWIIPLLSGELPLVDPREAGFCQNWNCTETTEKTETTQCTEITEPTEPPEATNSNTGNKSGVVWLGEVSVDVLVSKALPTKQHRNHHLLFHLARETKTEERRIGRSLTLQELDEVFAEWYRRAEEALYLRPGQTRDEYRLEFLEGLDNVKYLVGEGVLREAWDRAQKARPPALAMQFEDPQIRLLVTLCRELQRAHGAKEFYLSSRTVKTLFGLETHMIAWRWLRGLATKRIGILQEIWKGGPKTNKASRYRYLPPLED